jgi:ABC-2 type transport system permease protein
LAASAGRGYLAAVGVMFATVFAAQVVALLGYGQWFPWSVPAIYSGTAGPDQPSVGPIGYTLVALIGLAGVGGTVIWWRHADQTG